MKKGTRKVEVWLHLDNIKAIVTKALDDNVSVNLALSAIIQEWLGKKEIEPTSPRSYPSDIEQLEQKLESCQKTVESLKRQLRMA